MSDFTCLAEGQVYPADFSKTGINLNEIIVGSTGCGKSKSNGESRLLHTTDSSVVVPIAKKALRDNYQTMFEERGYETMNLDYAHPENCDIGYDPMDYIHSEEDIINTSRNVICNGVSKSRTGEIDPYWNDAATSILGAEIAFVLLNASKNNKKPSFADVVRFHRSIDWNTSGSIVRTNVDELFEALERKYPGNQAFSLWKTIMGLSSKTASCIISILNNALDKTFTENVVLMMDKPKKIKFHELGERKIALFITTSPMNKAISNLVNLMYADMFRDLFEAAEAKDEGHLDVPVHIICDDFACTGRINDFEDYISIFRAAGMSVTLLLQSESQLISMYGEAAATTIINNCDTYVYMGGMDVLTCSNISKRINLPVNKVLSLPLEQVYVFRRGSEPVAARRYQTMSDPLYKQVVEHCNE